MSFEDEEPPAENSSCEILWRGDPAETFSDWTIEIAAKNSKQDKAESKTNQEENPTEVVTTYHVHKGSLSYGKRSSGYFSKVFQAAESRNFEEGNTSVSKIKLDPLAADAFPAFLDYMYTERPLQICTENATALRWLGDYFEVTQLRWDARQFILKNISMDNVGIYYQHSTQLHEECVLKAVQTFTGKHILDIQLDNQIVLSAAPTFWADVLALNVSNPVSKTLSLHVSRIVATTASLHSEELSRETFNSLTGESVIPQVSSCVALSLCKVDDLLKLNEPEENNGTNLDSVSLQTRCADALAETWRNFAVKDNVESLVSRQPTFLVNLLLQSLEDAREKEANFQRSLNDANQTISSLQDDLNEAAAAARRSDSRWR